VWQIAVEQAAGGAIQIGYRWGRTNCHSSQPHFPGRLPDASEGGSGVQRVIIDRLGFSSRQAVCLMGAHTLGGALRKNSGYSGQWTKNPSAFSNKYYSELKNHLWQRVTIPPLQQGGTGKGQYNEPGVPGHMMLYPDIDMFWEGAGTCDITSNPATRCPLGPFSNFVNLYAGNNQQFLSDFAANYQQLCELTSDSLRSNFCSENQPNC